MDKEVVVTISVEYYLTIKMRKSYDLQQHGITLSEISQTDTEWSHLNVESKNKTKQKHHAHRKREHISNYQRDGVRSEEGLKVQTFI